MGGECKNESDILMYPIVRGRFMRRPLSPSLIAAAVLCWAGVYTPALSEEVLGAGSTFVYPVLAKWAEAYEAGTGVKIKYQAVGSGAGIRQIKSRTVDFGASDAPIPSGRTRCHGAHAVSDRRRRRGASRECGRHPTGTASIDRIGACEHLSRKDYQMERPSN